MISVLCLPEDLSNNPMFKLEVGEMRVLSWHHYQQRWCDSRRQSHLRHRYCHSSQWNCASVEKHPKPPRVSMWARINEELNMYFILSAYSQHSAMLLIEMCTYIFLLVSFLHIRMSTHGIKDFIRKYESAECCTLNQHL